MLILGNQRWRNRKPSFRPPHETIDTLHYSVAEIHSDIEAKRFVVEHHYSGSFPAARFRFGLYRGHDLVGVAVFSQPCNGNTLLTAFPGTTSITETVELGRFVLLDDVQFNGETWFLARCFTQLRQRVLGVLSFSDPLPRMNVEGDLVFPGHIGTIYQAFNGIYTGRGEKRTIRLFEDGTVLSDQSMGKIRLLKTGWRYSVEQLQAHGAGTFTPKNPKGWLAFWRTRLTRTVRHPGNHRYVWAFDKHLRKKLAAAGPYPKRCSHCHQDSPGGRVHESHCPHAVLRDLR